MRLYSYVVARDYAFAPNPFYGFCTLATCKPQIRRTAKVADWIIGTGSKRTRRDGHLLFAMRVTETLAFQQCWIDDRFRWPRPVKWCTRLTASSSLERYAASAMAITSWGSSVGPASALVIDSVLM